MAQSWNSPTTEFCEIKVLILVESEGGCTGKVFEFLLSGSFKSSWLKKSICGKERAGYHSASVTSLYREDGLAWHVKCSPQQCTWQQFCTIVLLSLTLHPSLLPRMDTGSQGATGNFTPWWFCFSFLFWNSWKQRFSHFFKQQSDWLYCKKKRSTRKVIFQHLRSFKFYQ